MKNIVLLSCDSMSDDRRAILCIFSVLSWRNEGTEALRIILYTDHPAYCEEHLPGLGVQFVILTPRLTQMPAGDEINQRMKISVMQDVYANYPDDDILFLDADTFVFNDLDMLLKKIQPGYAVMYAREVRLGNVTKKYREVMSRHLPKSNSYTRTFMRLIENNEFDLGGRKLSFNQLHDVWNAGVIGLQNDQLPLLKDILNFNDRIYAETQWYLSEQLAFGLVLQSFSKLSSAADCVKHYYRSKESVDYFINRIMDADFQELNMDDKFSRIKTATLKLNKVLRFDNYLSVTRRAFKRRRYKKGLKYAFRALIHIPLSSWSLVYIKSMYTLHMLKKKTA